MPSFVRSYLANNDNLDQRILQELTIQVARRTEKAMKLRLSKSANQEFFVEQIDMAGENKDLAGGQKSDIGAKDRIKVLHSP